MRHLVLRVYKGLHVLDSLNPSKPKMVSDRPLYTTINQAALFRCSKPGEIISVQRNEKVKLASEYQGLAVVIRDADINMPHDNSWGLGSDAPIVRAIKQTHFGWTTAMLR